LIALDFHLGPVEEVAIIGDPADRATQSVLRTVAACFQPNRITAFKSAGSKEADAAVPLLAGKTAIEGKLSTYICRNFACQSPLVGAESALTALAGSSGKPSESA